MTQINYRAEPEMNRALKANSATRRPTRNWRPRALDEFQERRLSSSPALRSIATPSGGHDRDVVYPTNQVNGMGFLRVRTPHDLTKHNCVNLRLPTSGALYAWEFAKDGREFSVRVEGQLTMSNIDPAINAALDGVGLSYAPKDLVRQHLESGRLQEVLADWAPTFQGYHLYYPSRRHPSPAFAAFVEAFRYRQR